MRTVTGRLLLRRSSVPAKSLRRRERTAQATESSRLAGKGLFGGHMRLRLLTSALCRKPLRGWKVLERSLDIRRGAESCTRGACAPQKIAQAANNLGAQARRAALRAWVWTSGRERTRMPPQDNDEPKARAHNARKRPV